MSKTIYVKWKTKLDNFKESPINHIEKIYLTREQAELDDEVSYIQNANDRFWIVGTYDDCVDDCYISEIIIDENEPILYFVKHRLYKSWSSSGIYIFMCDEDRMDFISSDLIGSNKNVIFMSDDTKIKKEALLKELNEKKVCQYETMIKKKYDEQITIETFEINISDFVD